MITTNWNLERNKRFLSLLQLLSVSNAELSSKFAENSAKPTTFLMLHAKPKQCVFKNGLFYYCPILVLNTSLVSFHNVADENRNSGGTSLRSCSRQETCILCERRLSICITRPQFLKAYLQLDDTLTRRKNCLPAVSDNNGCPERSLPYKPWQWMDYIVTVFRLVCYAWLETQLYVAR